MGNLGHERMMRLLCVLFLCFAYSKVADAAASQEEIASLEAEIMRTRSRLAAVEVQMSRQSGVAQGVQTGSTKSCHAAKTCVVSRVCPRKKKRQRETNGVKARAAAFGKGR